jgi:bisphosphoglycerate-dependent phosphoglycerate mutase
MLLASQGYEFDVAYTSLLKRATKSLWNMLDGCDQTFIPINRHWELNERHYGALQVRWWATHPTVASDDLPPDAPVRWPGFE